MRKGVINDRLLSCQNIAVRYGAVAANSQPEAASLSNKAREMWESV